MRLKLCLCFVSATAVAHESTNYNFLERKKYNKVRKKKTSEITPRLRNVIPRIQNIMVGQDQMNEDELFDVSFLLSSQQPTMTIIRSGRKLTIMHETTLSVSRKRIRVCVRKVKYDVLYAVDQSKFCWY